MGRETAPWAVIWLWEGRKADCACSEEAPFGPPTIWGRPPGSLTKSGCPSALPAGHCPLGCGRFRGVEAGQPLRSPAAETGAPLVEPLVDTSVELEDVEEFDDMEDDELVRWILFRGMNMPLTSSGFMGLSDCPPLMPHAGRLMLGKLGGLATAVMRTSGRMAPAEGRSGF